MIFKFLKHKVNLDNLKEEHYQSNYLEELKYIWETYIPTNGESTCLQGELLRRLEKIRWEAQEHGNINWWRQYDEDCDFIRDTLVKEKIYNRQQKE
ncbi:hypothetical protein [Streptococcus loxodontisalivarius]|uniref:Uncharacterized protein n=1 Tax=Streptococcus loxodontisalivarius TaxID=1349415 RepID=A0ABS2PQ26_9STRE|nr:hypothetical protein [Streptococcus loxodontisalivarius]MBM7641800.1 hypothetical protein [Streptococcus loxodontisalivarius]